MKWQGKKTLLFTLETGLHCRYSIVIDGLLAKVVVAMGWLAERKEKKIFHRQEAPRVYSR